MSKHTMSELYQLQGLPLKLKILMTKRRIRDWVNWYGESGVYISFSGGKDSTVLLHMAREMYPNLKACFVDTGLEFPEIRKFVKTFENVDIIKPNMGFKQVCEKYGFPLISKEISECVYGAKNYLKKISEDKTLCGDMSIDELLEHKEVLADVLNKRMVNKEGGNNQRLAIMLGMFTKDKNHPIKSRIHSDDLSVFSKEKYKYLLEAPFYVSHKCCDVMKKAPIKKYEKQCNRVPITAQMASESRLRTQTWLKNGCNAFDQKRPISNPMSFWTEQDVLLYIKMYNIPIASVYGEVVVDYEGMGQLKGQMSIADYMTASEKEEFELDKPLLKTTGCRRTGCILCGFGCHLEKLGQGRFERLRETHPKVLKSLDIIQNSGITYREAIDWINENNGKGNIIYY